ncbi:MULTISPECIES: hypothetical protein [Enterococcus]|nr:MULTISPECIES: hypothetical protein [Enterococcus]EGO2585305.1 hypothetical protein [Enterococcus faecalis]EGO2590713.1 hypothetical protein [Enterococcus faecalis]EGO2834770.1 hypothetical protein [Enterococcus faecalis]EGO7726281.1 hypothetical protein [Enterococcus faecalis]EGO7759605.1 hypothetical protein [Enterococcus faecalis]
MSEIDIKIYIPPYDKQNFYRLMGKYFAERVYRRKLPYLINTSNTIWFLLMNKDKVIGFSSIQISNEIIDIGDVFVEDEDVDNRKFLFKKVLFFIDKKCEKKCVRISLKKDQYLNTLPHYCFKQYRETKNYLFFRREINEQD